MKDPRRLLQDDSASPLLRDALRALDRRGPSVEALARLKAGLPSAASGAAPDGSSGLGSPAAGAAKGGSAGLGSGGAAGSGLAGLGLGSTHAVLLGVATSAALAIYGVATLQRSTEPAPGASKPSAAVVEATPRAKPADSSPRSASELARTEDGAPDPARAAGSARDSAPGGMRGAPSRKRERAAKERSESNDASPAVTLSSAPRAEPAERERGAPIATSATAEREAEPSPSAAARDSVARASPSGNEAGSSRERAPEADAAHAAQTAPAAARRSLEPQDEAGLLYRAKRLAARDPDGALRLLESHAKYFPRAGLAEERDVLTIQLHRRLGHSADAARLAAEFRARYPQSIYLRSLSP